MCASYLPVHLFTNYLKVCASKLNRVNVVSSWSILNVVCRLERTKSTFGPMTHHSLCLHAQSKVDWWQATFHRTLVSNRKPVSDVATNESSERFPDVVTKPLRKDRLAQQSLLRQMIGNKGQAPWTDDDWLQLADSLSSTGQESWEVICMHVFYVDKNVCLGRSLMSYIERHTTEPDLVLVTFYIGLLGETCADLHVQHEETYKYFQYVLSRTDVLDAASIEVLVSGLSSTRYYQQCIQLLEMCRQTSCPSSTSLVKLLKASLKNHDVELCQATLSQIEQFIDPTGITSFLPQVIENGLSGNEQKCVDMMMNFMEKHKLLMKRTELEELVDAFHRYQPNQWTAKYGFIHHRNGHCSVCGHQMKKSEVSLNDFQSIRATFLDQVIIGSNVFFKSSPEEVSSFVKFIENMGPFDVVIDGLNVMYHGCRKPDFKQLCKVVEYFSLQGKKVLVLGSRMLSNFTKYRGKLVNKPAVYMTSSTKCDDAFFLYAALHSGKQTLVVSSDKLRDHKFLLKPSLRPIFQQWILSAQVYDWFISRSGDFIIGKRHLYVMGPAKDDGGWHIPENDISASNPFGKFSVLCLRKETDCQKTEKSFRQITSATPGYTHNQQHQQNIVKPSLDRTERMAGSTTKSSNIRSKSEKEWFDN